LMAGVAAGFGSAVGAPWAGLIFSLEVVHGGTIRPFAVWDCAVAAAAGYATTLLVGAPHTLYPAPTFPAFNQDSLALAAGLGILCGLGARLFIRASHRLEQLLRDHISYAPLRPALAGLILMTLFIGLDLQRYAGLGISVIQDALQSRVPWHDPLLKAAFTVLTVGSAFKGGEFIPLVFIGSTMGNVLGGWFARDMTLLAAVGFGAVFAGASNTPLACTVMAVELFGWPIAPYAAAACYLSFLVSGKKGIYSRER
jgi:H+/Cl- antiporter ClcA